MACINCGTETSGKYCSNCGQRAEVRRITFKEGWHDFWARVYGFDGMFPRTLRDLTIRPGLAAKGFIDGNRALYYGPVGYFFLMITLFLLLLSMIDLEFVDYMNAMQKSIPIEQKGTAAEKSIQGLISNNIKLFAFLFIPFQAFAARYFYFRKSGLNFLEHSILPLYAMGHWYWFNMLLAVYFKLTGNVINVGVELLLVSLYMGFAYTRFVNNQSKVKSFFKGLGIYFTAYFMFLLTIVIIMIVVVLIIAVIDPESLKMFRPPKS